jgi:hypothetical protein
VSQDEIPPYIPSRLNFNGVNPQEFEKPEIIQKLQASLACTLRTALENILIEDITFMNTETNEMARINIDPTDYMMSSNGSKECFEFTSNTEDANRRLQVTGTIVNVDYLVVEPSQEILVLNTDQLDQIITSSPDLTALAQSIGSQQVSTELNVESYSVHTPQTTGTAATKTEFPTLALVLSVFGVAGLVGLGIAGRKYLKTKKQTRMSIRRTPVPAPILTDSNTMNSQLHVTRVQEYGVKTTFNPVFASV